MSYYQYHVFFCTNQRQPGAACCANLDAQALRDYAKQRTKELGLHKDGKSRINTAGCLNRCSEGPVLVVYPEGIWYTYVDREDIDEIIESHLQNGKPVTRLMLDPV
jgi:(2Fe-2S) ferredoxin